MQNYTVVIHKDSDGYYVASVPELIGCHTQAKSLDELASRTKEAIELYIETKGHKKASEFVGVQQIEVDVA